PHHGHARRRGNDDRHQRLSRLRAGDLPRLRHQLRAACGAGDPGADGLGDAGAAEGIARLRDRRHLHPGRGHHPAGRDLAAAAGDPDVPAVRSRDHRRAHGRAAARRRRRQRHRLMRPAGFWRRCAAWTLDAALVALPVLLLCRDTMHRAAATFTQSWGALVDAVAQRMAAMILSPATSASTAPGPGAMTSLARDSLRDPALLAAAADLQSALIGLLWLPMAAFVTLFLAWCVGFERSPLQATPGKRALGLRAVDLAGGRIGTGVALAR